MKIKRAGFTLAAAAATALAPFGALAFLALTPMVPVAHATCPGLTDEIGNNTAAAHNSCCGDKALMGKSDPTCGAPAAVPAPPPPPGQLPTPVQLPCNRSTITICPPGATLPPGVPPPPN